MKVLKYKYNPDKKGVFKVSVVKNPAVGEGDLVLMAAQEIKGVFYSPVMIPDVKIQRIDPNTGEKYLVYYDAETVEKLSNNYFKNNGNANTNIEHSDSDVQGIYPVESWIVTDPENDKSKALGMPTQKQGTWIMGYKCESEEILDKIQNQLLQGLSIEGHLDTEEDMDSPISKFSKINMKKTILEKFEDFKAILMSAISDEEKPEAEATEVVEEVKEEVEEMAEEIPAEQEPSDVEKELATAQATIVEMQKKIDDLEAEKAKNTKDATLMSAQLEEVTKAFDSYKAVKMSSQKLADVPSEKKDYSKMTPLEKFRATK
jgi:cytochrome c556